MAVKKKENALLEHVNAVKFLIDNLSAKFGYTSQGANEICIYVIDNDLANKFK